MLEQATINKLKGIIPDSVLAQIPDTAAKFNITTPLRLAHFLSQAAHESANFTETKENLNYSAEGLKKTFGKYFPGNLNESYAHNPEKIADRVYANRMGNGDEASGDGYKYCGRGFIQLTGKVNYAAFDKLVSEDILTSPALVGTKYPLMSAAFFFNENKLWTICDKGSDSAVILELTKRINGGENGLSERTAYFNKFYKALNS
jgi:putative chitinase